MEGMLVLMCSIVRTKHTTYWTGKYEVKKAGIEELVLDHCSVRGHKRSQRTPYLGAVNACTESTLNTGD